VAAGLKTRTTLEKLRESEGLVLVATVVRVATLVLDSTQRVAAVVALVQMGLVEMAVPVL
jgi:hypothetical protein